MSSPVGRDDGTFDKVPGPGTFSPTSSFNVFLFSVPVQVEGFGQVQGRFIQRPAVNGGPKVQDVALDCTIGLKALADFFAEVNRDGALEVGGLAMHGTGAAALKAAAAQVVAEVLSVQQPQLVRHERVIPPQDRRDVLVVLEG